MSRWVTQLARFRYTLFCLLIWFTAAPGAQAQDAMPLPQGRVGTSYSAEIKTEGGLGPLTWHLSGGQLPPGLNVSPAGRIEGTPTGAASQPFTFEMTVSDSSLPPQIVTQRFSILIAAPPLRIVGSASATGPAPLKIIGPAKPITAEQGPATRLESQNLVAEPISYIPPREPHFVVPLLQASAAAAPKQETDQTPADKKGKDKAKTPDDLGTLDPANFTWVYEDPKTGDRQPIYCPPKRTQNDKDPKTDKQRAKYCSSETTQKQPIQLVADYESSIIVIPDGNLMGGDVAFNKLFITARLTSGTSSKDVVVNGYSEIGKDQATMAAQSGTAFQSAANIQAMVLNMAYTAGDIVESVYSSPKLDPKCGSPDDSGKMNIEAWRCRHQEIDFRGDDAKATTEKIAKAGSVDADDIKALTEKLRLYQPEIQAISNFLVQKENLELVEKLGVKIFWIDRESMVAIAQQYKDNIQIAFDTKSTPTAKLQAVQDLLERTKLVYKDLGDIREEIKTKDMKSYVETEVETHTEKEWQGIYEKALKDYAERKRKEAASELERLLATGSISLTENQAKDGDRLTITVQSVPSSSTTGGIPVVFEVAVKKFGAKIQLSPSFLFVRRLHVRDTDVNPPSTSINGPLNRVNFAPSPGMTFGIAYFKRGNSGWDKFERGLGPGAGINVTFMNYNDPGFDLTKNQFTNTSGTNAQIGAGLIGSLFDDKIQVTYGWNLNVERARAYFGVGFGFIEIGKELAKYIPK
jgi:hypothetical protein